MDSKITKTSNSNITIMKDEVTMKEIIPNLEVEYITQGQVMLKGRVLQYQLKLLDKFLKETGLEIIVDKRTLLIQKIKNIVFEMV